MYQNARGLCIKMQGGYALKCKGNKSYSPCILIHNPLAFNELFISPSLPFTQSKPHSAFQTVDCGVMKYIPPRKNKGIRAKVKISDFKDPTTKTAKTNHYDRLKQASQYHHKLVSIEVTRSK